MSDLQDQADTTLSMKMDKYKQLVNEEDLLFDKLNTYNKIIEVIYHTIFKQGDSLDISTTREIINCIHKMESIIRMDLMQVRLAKNVLACQIDREKRL